jgi:hypothetical protein
MVTAFNRAAESIEAESRRGVETESRGGAVVVS